VKKHLLGKAEYLAAFGSDAELTRLTLSSAVAAKLAARWQSGSKGLAELFGKRGAITRPPFQKPLGGFRAAEHETGIVRRIDLAEIMFHRVQVNCEYHERAFRHVAICLQGVHSIFWFKRCLCVGPRFRITKLPRIYLPSYEYTRTHISQCVDRWLSSVL
jgi:hypothetical protein